ncbi:MAG: plasmid encoded RepA protein [Treponema sp.]|nr:plasmid encoded RepA protein [Treponema sp.]MBP3772917.1 plasmid encoded RepA protein [Treponema sp.]
MTDEENKYLQELFPEEEARQEIVRKFRSYIASPFIAAALPLKDVKKNVFERKYNNINFKLTSDIKVPYGKNGRLLLTIMTTHAVLDKDANPENPVVLQYTSLQQLLDELQLPKQRGKEIKEQLECFSGASFVFREKKVQKTQKYLFKEFFSEDENLGTEVTATWNSSGIVPFFESMSYVDIDENGKEKKSIGLTIVLSDKFTKLSKAHSVPIDYGVYKEISSVVGKDLYAWFVYRNNSITEPIFISRESLVNQFLPVKEKSYESEERVNWNTIKEQINLIKKKYYPDLNVSVAQDNSGITLAKSKPVILPNDKHYVLVTSNL